MGRVHVITGPGKGKTTAAFGLALRAAGHGLRVCVVQFMKSGKETGEVLAAKRIRGISVYQYGTGKFVDKDRITESDRECAAEALAMVCQLLEEGACNLLVMDEVNLASAYGLVKTDEVLDMLKSRKKDIEVVLTGRNAPREFIDYADYVSCVDDAKHPFSRGVKARKGVEW